MDGAALNLFGTVGHGKRQPPLQQTAEQQIQVGAVGLDITLQQGKHILTVLPGGVIHVGHVGIVQLEHTEATIKGLAGVFGGDFLCGTADALFADLT